MTGRETVIRHLQIIRTWAAVGKEPIYHGIEPRCCEDVEKWADDALALLREQEPLPPDIGQLITGIYAICADCGHTLTLIADARGPQVEYHPKFCPECGRAVKWE